MIDIIRLNVTLKGPSFGSEISLDGTGLDFLELRNMAQDIQNELYRYYTEINGLIDIDLEDHFASIDIGKTPLIAIIGLIQHKMAVEDWEVIVDKFREEYGI